jgi:predicted DCC family thiol-disulfide oxidoreductase YuxK
MSDPTNPFAPRDIGATIERAHEAAEKYQKPTLVMVENPVDGTLAVPAILGREGVRAVPKSVFAEYLDHPERRTGTAAMTRLESFIEHVLRFKNAESVVFAKDDRSAPGLTAVLDYHDAGADGTPRFGTHRTAFHFPLSDEWKTWLKFNAAKMNMAEFAQFLEERVNDIDFVESTDDLNEDIQRFIGATGLDKIASPSRLIELSRNLQIHERSNIKAVQNLSSGEGVLRFENEHTDVAGAPVDVPGLFVICIPVFAHDGYYRIAARLRYRMTGEGIVFWYDLWRADLVFDHAFDQACQRVKAETGLPLLIGAPE